MYHVVVPSGVAVSAATLSNAVPEPGGHVLAYTGMAFGAYAVVALILLVAGALMRMAAKRQTARASHGAGPNNR